MAFWRKQNCGGKVDIWMIARVRVAEVADRFVQRMGQSVEILCTLLLYIYLNHGAYTTKNSAGQFAESWRFTSCNKYDPTTL